jgi:membrane protease YdiL (CAAX protease family)
MIMKPILSALAKVIGYFAAVFTSLVFALIPMQLIFGDTESFETRLELLWFTIPVLVGAAVVNLGMAWFGKSIFVRLGWPDRRAFLRWFGIGTLIGLVMAGGILIFIRALWGGQFIIENGELSQYLGYVLPLLGCLFILALCEEWIFRGYPLSVLSPVIGRGWANLFVALFFTLSHWGDDGWNLLVVVNLILFSLINGALRYSQGGIVAAWAFHFSWNSIQVLAGAIMSGDDFEVPFVHFSSQGPSWLSGGAFGPEGSIITTVVGVFSFVLIWKFLQLKNNNVDSA